jgi:hypothetical protein
LEGANAGGGAEQRQRGGRRDVAVAAVARNTGDVDDMEGSSSSSPGTIIVEEVVVPLVLNTLVRHETPHPIEIDTASKATTTAAATTGASTAVRADGDGGHSQKAQGKAAVPPQPTCPNHESKN